MTKRTQKCTQCGSRLNITTIEIGTKFACFNCGAILVAGQAVEAVRKSLSDGPVFKPKVAEDDTAVPTRSGGRRRAAPAGDGGGGSKAPLLIGVGAVVVIGIVVAVMMGGGDGGGGIGTMGGGDGGGGGSTATKENAEQWWARRGGETGAANAADLRAMLAEGKAAGYASDPVWGSIENDIYTALLAKAPADAGANKHFGRVALQSYPGFVEVWAAMFDKQKLLTDDFRAFQKKYEDRVEGAEKVWLSKDEFAAASEVLGRVKAWVERVKSDPTVEWVAKGRLRARDELGKFDAGVAVARPYVLFLGFRKGPESGTPSAADTVAGKYANVLKAVAQQFETNFRAPMNLPVQDTTALYFWLFRVKGEYDTFIAEKRDLFGGGADALATFHPRSRWAFGGIPADKVQQRHVSHELGHTAVYQLHWLYAKDPKKRFSYFDEWNGLWFTYGFAAWLGGGVEYDDARGTAKWTGLDPRRKEHLKTMADQNLPWIPLRELTQVESWGGLQRWVGSWWAILQDNEDVAEESLDIIRQAGPFRYGRDAFYAHAWALAHFLNEGEHKDRFKDLLWTALRGKRKPEKYQSGRLNRWRYTHEAFAEIFGLKSDADWEALDKKFAKHLKKLAR
ncbi:MAG: hypothetical protein ACYTGN_17845 [Planctomycetota bacterium]|jgi:hypothetical protein